MAVQSDNTRLKGKGHNINQENQEEDAAARAKEAAEREARINYTLDMVVHDLVSHGHLHPAKFYLLKTPEMKGYIGKMCDKLNERKQEDLNTKPSHVSRNKNNATKTGTKGQTHKPQAKKESSFTKEFNVVRKSKPPPKDQPTANNFESQNQQKSDQFKKVEPWVTPRDIADDRKRRPIVSRAENRLANGSKIRKELTVPSQLAQQESLTTGLSAQAYRAKVDISGFDNDEISLDLDGRKLVITAQRAKKGTQNARKFTEVIEIPEGVNLENLKMGRRLDGSLLIEEFVNGID